MFTGGGLRLKGEGSVSKKKKSKKGPKIPTELKPVESKAIDSKTSQKTESEIRFEEIRKRRAEERAAKQAEKSHKDRVADFNKYLGSLSEHHDIPRIGPG